MEKKFSKPKLEDDLILHTKAYLSEQLGTSHFRFALLVDCLLRRVQLIKSNLLYERVDVLFVSQKMNFGTVF